MENPDGWMLACKLCGKNHEVPEGLAPYWTEGGAFKNVMPGEVKIGCPDNPEQTADYTFTDFVAYRLSTK